MQAHDGLVTLIRRINSRTSYETTCLWTVQVQDNRKPFRCLAITVVGDDYHCGRPIGLCSRQPRPQDSVRHSQLRPLLSRALEHTDLGRKADFTWRAPCETEDRGRC
jgi:hypothetical protein